MFGFSTAWTSHSVRYKWVFGRRHNLTSQIFPRPKLQKKTQKVVCLLEFYYHLKTRIFHPQCFSSPGTPLIQILLKYFHVLFPLSWWQKSSGLNVPDLKNVGDDEGGVIWRELLNACLSSLPLLSFFPSGFSFSLSLPACSCSFPRVAVLYWNAGGSRVCVGQRRAVIEPICRSVPVGTKPWPSLLRGGLTTFPSSSPACSSRPLLSFLPFRILILFT